MNRDALLASIIGFGIGLLITGVLLIGPTITKGFPQIKFPTISFSLPGNNTPKTTPAPTPPPIIFSVSNPITDAVVSESSLTVSGTAPSASTIIVAGPNDEDVQVATADNKFSGKVTLTEGKNDITVTNYVDGKGTAQLITVFYTKENF